MMKLGQLILWLRAKVYLRRYKPVVIGVAGSTGKSLVKEAIMLVLTEKYRVRVAPYSYNTPIGIAMSVLGVTSKIVKENWLKILTLSKARELTRLEPEVIVLELGASQPGDIDWVTKQLPFKIGIITNVQSAHLRLFTSKEYVAHEIESLAADIPRDGTLILNADDQLAAQMADRAKARVMTFGRSDQAIVRLLRLTRRGNRGFAGEIVVDGKYYELYLPQMVADYQVSHVLAALAVAQVLKIDIGYAVKRLQKLAPLPGRMNLLAGAGGSLLLDDSYSAPPESMVAAVDTLQELSAQRKIAVLGDMMDLGGETLPWHQEVGQRVAKVVEILVTVGTSMRQAGAAALKTAKIDLHHFEDSRDVGKWLRGFLRAGDMVLIKGSRDMHMEEVTRRLLGDPKDEDKLVRQ